MKTIEELVEDLDWVDVDFDSPEGMMLGCQIVIARYLKILVDRAGRPIEFEEKPLKELRTAEDAVRDLDGGAGYKILDKRVADLAI